MNNNFDINSNMDFKSKVDFDSDIDLDRLKRSIKFHPGRLFHFKRREPETQSKINNGKLVTKSTINMTSIKKPKGKHNKAPRKKRFGNFTDEGLTIEKNKIMIQYKPSHLIAKCSHPPKDVKSHEKEYAHPFYKNTQRLDELLDQFMDKKLPDFLGDRLGSELLIGDSKNKHKQAKEEVIIVKDEDLLKDYEQNERTEDSLKNSDAKFYLNQRLNDNQNNDENVITGKESDKEELTTPTVKTFVAKEAPKVLSNDIKNSANVFENDFFEDSDGVERKQLARNTTSGYGILLSISTLA